MAEVRVRFAPSPTGYLHVGGARTALFNWLFARRHKGRFILRIEDTDRERSRPEYEAAILRDLQWLGLNWDEGPSIGGPHGPYVQTERAPIYKEHLKKLLASRAAYPCFCSQKDLETERESANLAGLGYHYSGRCRDLSQAEVDHRKKTKQPYAIRLRVPPGVTVFHDLIRGEVKVDHAELDDYILVRTGGEPTYNFVVTVDDAVMRMSHVIRGEDHLSNTPKQILLYQALGFEPPIFAHLPLILGEDRTPLSKRHLASSVSEFKRLGYLPEALVNYLALLGWSLDGKTDLISQADLIKNFALERVHKAPASFDYNKLLWMNGQYIRKADDEFIFQRCLEYLWDMGGIDELFMRASGPPLKRMLGLVKPSLKTINEVGDQILYFLGEVHVYDPEGLAKHLVTGNLPILEDAEKILDEAFHFNAMALEERFRAAATAAGKKFADYVHPLRLAITGRTVSPNLFEVIEILGKGRCIVRLKRFAQMIRTSPGPGIPGPG